MDEKKDFTESNDIEREHLINILTDNLPVLRARIGSSQDDLSNIIGFSRQTYSAIETKKRNMSWGYFYLSGFVL